MSKICGFVKWWDERDGEGILCDLNGNEYYFNVWSFPHTHYRVKMKSGILKTRLFPGLFRDRTVYRDKACSGLKNEQAIIFSTIGDGVTWLWGNKVKLDYSTTAKEAIILRRLLWCKESLARNSESTKSPESKKLWNRYYLNRIGTFQKRYQEMISF